MKATNAFSPLDAGGEIPMFALVGPRGGMVDTGDLKSLDREVIWLMSHAVVLWAAEPKFFIRFVRLRSRYVVTKGM